MTNKFIHSLITAIYIAPFHGHSSEVLLNTIQIKFITHVRSNQNVLHLTPACQNEMHQNAPWEENSNKGSPVQTKEEGTVFPTICIGEKDKECTLLSNQLSCRGSSSSGHPGWGATKASRYSNLFNCSL